MVSPQFLDRLSSKVRHEVAISSPVPKCGFAQNPAHQWLSCPCTTISASETEANGTEADGAFTPFPGKPQAMHLLATFLSTLELGIEAPRMMILATSPPCSPCCSQQFILNNTSGNVPQDDTWGAPSNAPGTGCAPLSQQSFVDWPNSSTGPFIHQLVAQFIDWPLARFIDQPWA